MSLFVILVRQNGSSTTNIHCVIVCSNVAKNQTNILNSSNTNKQTINVFIRVQIRKCIGNFPFFIAILVYKVPQRTTTSDRLIMEHSRKPLFKQK